MLYSLMDHTTYDQAEKIVDKLISTANCNSTHQTEWLKSYISELVALIPQVREHTEHRTRMLKLYKEKVCYENQYRHIT